MYLFIYLFIYFFGELYCGTHKFKANMSFNQTHYIRAYSFLYARFFKWVPFYGGNPPSLSVREFCVVI